MQNKCDVLTPSLRKYIEDNLGKLTLNKIENRLIEKYGVGLSQAIKEFSKLDDVLKEIFGMGAIELESRFVQNNIRELSINVQSWAILKKLLVTSIQKSIEQNLGKSTLSKIESRLSERHNLNVIQSIEDFTKFDSVLQEFFGPGSRGLESRFIQNITKDKLLMNGFSNLGVHEKELAREFLKPFAIKDKKILLETLQNDSTLIRHSIK